MVSERDLSKKLDCIAFAERLSIFALPIGSVAIVATKLCIEHLFSALPSNNIDIVVLCERAHLRLDRILFIGLFGEPSIYVAIPQSAPSYLGHGIPSP